MELIKPGVFSLTDTYPGSTDTAASRINDIIRYAYARNPDKIPGEWGDRVRVIIGEMSDADTIDQTVRPTRQSDRTAVCRQPRWEARWHAHAGRLTTGRRMSRYRGGRESRIRARYICVVVGGSGRGWAASAAKDWMR